MSTMSSKGLRALLGQSPLQKKKKKHLAASYITLNDTLPLTLPLKNPVKKKYLISNPQNLPYFLRLPHEIKVMNLSAEILRQNKSDKMNRSYSTPKLISVVRNNKAIPSSFISKQKPFNPHFNAEVGNSKKFWKAASGKKLGREERDKVSRDLIYNLNLKIAPKIKKIRHTPNSSLLEILKKSKLKRKNDIEESKKLSVNMHYKPTSDLQKLLQPKRVELKERGNKAHIIMRLK